MEGGGLDKEVASSKFNASIQKSIPYVGPKWRQNGQNRHLIYDQNGLKTLPFGAAHTYMAHIREYPPGFNSSRLINFQVKFEGKCKSKFCFPLECNFYV